VVGSVGSEVKVGGGGLAMVAAGYCCWGREGAGWMVVAATLLRGGREGTNRGEANKPSPIPRRWLGHGCRGHRGRQASEDVTWAWEVASRERRGGKTGAR
jgi:hypothetical protein